MKKLSLCALLVAASLQGCASMSDSLFGWFSEDEEAAKTADRQQQAAQQALMQKRAEAEQEVDPQGLLVIEEGQAPAMNETADMPEMASQQGDSAMVKPEQPMAPRFKPVPAMTGGQAIDLSKRFSTAELAKVRASKERQIQTSVENDYYVFQELNHQFIKNYTAPNQYKEINRSVGHFVMDLIANMDPELYMAPLVVRPMKLKVNNVANANGGKELVTSLIAAQMQDYGFVVFDGRRPKGKFNGDELILETKIESYGEQFVLYGTLRQLSSNKVAGTHQAFISDYFFRNIKDGVEVYESDSEY